MQGKIVCIGLPQIVIGEKSNVCYGNGITLVSNARFATLGHSKRCKILVYKNATLKIGNKVGMSNVTIVATRRIVIGNNVMIGGGVTIVDSDFHSMNYNDWFTSEDEKNMLSKDVVIGNNVFIGMDCIILKGVCIGDNAIIAAGSVVARDIPHNQIWGGNPVTFIKERIIYDNYNE